MKTDRFERIGQVLKSNGTDGQLLLGLSSVTPEDISETEPVFIFFDELPVPFFIEKFSSRSSSRVLAYLTDTHCLKDAEELVGKALYMRADEDEEEENFDGWTLFDAVSAKVVGEIVTVDQIPGNPCLVVNLPSSEEVLIPLNEELIVNVDENAREVTMNIPDGLIDIR